MTSTSTRPTARPRTSPSTLPASRRPGGTAPGVWRWKVRANFPSLTASVKAESAYSAPSTYVRRIAAPGDPRITHDAHRLSFSWAPDAAATKYRLQVSDSDSFTPDPRAGHDAEHQLGAVADQPALRRRRPPLLAAADPGLRAAGRGVAQRASSRLPRGLRINVAGVLRRRGTSRVVVDGHQPRQAGASRRGAGQRDAAAAQGQHRPQGRATFNAARPARRPRAVHRAPARATPPAGRPSSCSEADRSTRQEAACPPPARPRPAVSPWRTAAAPGAARRGRRAWPAPPAAVPAIAGGERASRRMRTSRPARCVVVDGAEVTREPAPVSPTSSRRPRRCRARRRPPRPSRRTRPSRRRRARAPRRPRRRPPRPTPRRPPASRRRRRHHPGPAGRRRPR